MLPDELPMSLLLTDCESGPFAAWHVKQVSRFAKLTVEHLAHRQSQCSLRPRPSSRSCRLYCMRMGSEPLPCTASVNCPCGK